MKWVGWPDHHPPPLGHLFKVVGMIDSWLEADPQNVVVVHKLLILQYVASSLGHRAGVALGRWQKARGGSSVVGCAVREVAETASQSFVLDLLDLLIVHSFFLEVVILDVLEIENSFFYLIVIAHR